MKPPPRRRAAPARYLGEVTGPATWSAREKRQLVRLLQARQGQPEPDAAELARELQGRSEAEIRVFLQQLKGRVAREAIQKVHPGGLQGPRRREAQPPAPIEVWTDLAEKITGPLEEALAVAFSQVLTIAATEPVTLLHSKPPKPTQARGKPLLLSAPGGQEDSAPKIPSPAPKAPSSTPETSDPAPEKPSASSAGPSTEEDFAVDFEKIYKYLSSLSRSGRSPELSAAAPQPSPAGGSLGPAAEGDGAGSKAPEESPPATKKAEPSELKSSWQAAGICPLNPFLVPLELLGRVATPARTGGQGWPPPVPKPHCALLSAGGHSWHCTP
ncbi:PREDICTED: snRNA-activating protein complex subunit 2 isoform X3 [Rhinopithecus bieti]|uniref:snRNA-activating protein complex subunit 2 isoform X3 n=1 Tax=Rhinopithecus bieti TaxID=61621 RepID=UPI00083BCD4F|nr:PREDICTED: snRNA-activating protein complex subunit 2 isoform X3 [Rhinopithecus bieti]